MTQNLKFLKDFNKIFLMDSGKITACGDYPQMRDIELIRTYMNRVKEERVKEERIKEKKGKREKETREEELPLMFLKKDDNINKVIESFKKEDKEVGEISKKTRILFIKLTGGILPVLILSTLSFGVNSFTMYSNEHLEEWAYSEIKGTHNMDYLRFYILIWVIITIFAILRKLLEIHINHKISSNLHKKMTSSLLSSKIQNFLDRVPFGRILNRFSNDLGILDSEIVDHYSALIDGVCNTIVLFFTIYYTLGVELILFMLVYLFLMKIIERYYMNGKREYGRLRQISSSPLVNNFSDVYKGLAQIRVYRLQDFFRERFVCFLREKVKNDLINFILVDWYCLVSNTLQLGIIQLPAFLSILYYYGDHSPSKLGLFFICIFGINETLNQLIESKMRFDTSLISVERCDYFTKIEEEDGYNIEEGFKEDCFELEEFSRHEIEFQMVSASYLGMENQALKDVNFYVKKGEKLAIIGRTGSGKSTVIKMLWRYLDSSDGKVLIKGRNVKEVNLKQLRKRVNFILQDQFFIEGTLKENLMLYKEAENGEEEMLNILNKLNFENEDFIREKLEMRVEFKGGNLSKGEQQIINLARCLLEKRRDIIVMDEAMASIDALNEEKVRGLLREFYNGKTVVVVTHNLKNLERDFDRVLVMEKGRVKDFGRVRDVVCRQGLDII